MKGARAIPLACAILALSAGAKATHYTLTAGGMITYVSTRNHDLHHIRPGAKWSYAVTFDDQGETNTSFNSSIGQWGFPTIYTATVSVGTFSYTTQFVGVTVFHRTVGNSNPFDGVEFGSQISSSGVSQSVTFDLRSSQSIFPSIGIPTTLPSGVWDLAHQFSFTRISQVNSGTVTDTFGGTILYANLATS